MCITLGHVAFTCATPISVSLSSVSRRSPWARISTVSPGAISSTDATCRAPLTAKSRTTLALCTMLPSMTQPPFSAATCSASFTARSTP